MSVKRVNVGPRLSEVAVFGDVGYFSDIVVDDADADISAQMRDMPAQIERLLREVGSDKTKILQCQIFLASLKSFDTMNAVWDEWVARGHTPPHARCRTGQCSHGRARGVSRRLRAGGMPAGASPA
jgi:enamine deaminase RidA (YjgF/YER057c/UK114 family)